MKRGWILVLLALFAANLQAQSGVPFSTQGVLSYGGAAWQANGLINSLIFYPGDTLEMGLAVAMRLPDGDVNLAYNMGAVLLLKQIYTADGQQLPYDVREPWSPFTENGLPLTNVTVPARALLTGTTEEITVIDEETLSFNLAYRVSIPTDIEAGIYTVLLAGFASVDDSKPFGWYQNRVFSTTGTGNENAEDNRLPLVIRIGNVEPANTEWALLKSQLPNDSIGVLFDEQPIILPLGEVANLAPMLVAPSFIPAFPSGVLTGRIESLGVNRPLGTDFIAVQNTTAIPLTTFTGAVIDGSFLQLVPAESFYEVTFQEYGFYRIVAQGSINDIFGNRYTGGGTYEVAVAESIQLLPSIPAGYPLVVNTPLALGFEVLPTIEAVTEVTIAFQPLTGESIRTVRTKKTTNGRVMLDANDLNFPTAGVYSIRYRAQAVDSEGRLWVGDMTTHGVVTEGDQLALEAHGRRGLDGYDRNPQAHFDSANYPFDAALSETIVNTPYLNGDVVYIPNQEGVGLRSVLTMQDSIGRLAARLFERYPNLVNPEGDLQELIRRDSLPLVYPDAFGVLTLSSADSILDIVAQGNADGLYKPIVPTFDLTNGTLLTWFGGAIIREPQLTTVGYSALVEITDDDSARVVRRDDEPIRILVMAGRDGSVFRPDDVEHVLTVQTFGNTIGEARADGGFFSLLGLRVIAPDGTITQHDLFPYGVFGLQQGRFHVETFTQQGVYRVQIQLAETRETLVEVRWLVTGETKLVTTEDSIEEIAGGQATLRIDVPETWTNMQGSVIVRGAQGTVLYEAEAVTGRQWVVTLTRDRLLRDVPWATGWLHVQLALVGTNENGETVIATRAYSLQAERLVTLD